MTDNNYEKGRADALEKLLIHVAAQLQGAVWLLERGGKKAAASDKIFEQSLSNYRNAIDRALEALAQQPQQETNTNTGHGHVRLRPDGVRVGCGGPGMCPDCSEEAILHPQQWQTEPQPERGCGTCKHHNREGFSVVVKACRGCGVHPLYPNWQPKEGA